jgi:hypothetical protein
MKLAEILAILQKLQQWQLLWAIYGGGLSEKTTTVLAKLAIWGERVCRRQNCQKVVSNPLLRLSEMSSLLSMTE